MSIFGLPPGADFPAELVDGLVARYGDLPPEDFARIRIYVNTRRMQRRIVTLFGDRGPRLLPAIRLITDLGRDLVDPSIPPSVSPIRRRLELANLVRALLDADPEIAPRSALYDLADSLADLLDEMQGEGAGRPDIARIDTSDASDHWKRRRAFIEIILGFLEDAHGAPDPELRQRLAVEKLTEEWALHPPGHPVIVAGSTGSRGTTAAFMDLVSSLPQGHLVLPGFDFDLPDELWEKLEGGLAPDDHPQFRFQRLLKRLKVPASEVTPWTSAPPPCPARNRLVSLAMRPAPVTHQWMTEGPGLGDLRPAFRDVSLVEATSPHAEALTIAVRLRKAAEDGTTAALVSPDRVLTRRVAAHLDRWGLVPDDSAGQPLALSPPGRFLRHVAGLFGRRLSAEDLLVLLTHPLTHTGIDRGPHLRHTRDLELHVRRRGVPFPTRQALADWAGRREGRTDWIGWIFDTLDGLDGMGSRALTLHVSNHLEVASRIAAGPGAEAPGQLWEKAAGVEARRVMQELERESIHGAAMSADDYRTLLDGILNRAEVRDPITPHPGIMIWGTMEARVQGADLVILAGLNEGVWPALPDHDPWLNRQMRKEAGLLLPERQIGLAAHDFQQAVSAREVMLTRSKRDAEAETVPSRWLNRLHNLLAGLESGKLALDDMKERGKYWSGLAALLEPKPAEPRPSPRPAPRPPVSERPRQLSVTQIRTLIRDPYAIYVREILRLRPVNPLRQQPDAPLRGTVLHDIFEDYVRGWQGDPPETEKSRLLSIADAKLEEGAPWPVARRIWRAKLERIADRFIAEETERRKTGSPAAIEGVGALDFGEVGFRLIAKADRIDRLHDGGIVIYDYKTGSIPSPRQVREYDKQLLLEAIIAEAGGFQDLPPAPVATAAYIGLGSKDGTHPIDLTDPEFDLRAVAARFVNLIRAYGERSLGYASRRAMEREDHAGDYDHLARYGEWDDTALATPEDVP